MKSCPLTALGIADSCGVLRQIHSDLACLWPRIGCFFVHEGSYSQVSSFNLQFVGLLYMLAVKSALNAAHRPRHNKQEGQHLSTLLCQRCEHACSNSNSCSYLCVRFRTTAPRMESDIIIRHPSETCVGYTLALPTYVPTHLPFLQSHGKLGEWVVL